VPVTDVANGCFRSSANYPALVAKKLGADLQDRTCSGARIVHLTTSEFADVPAQLPAVTQATTLVTIGIGGNDQSVFQQLTTTCPRLRSSDPTGAPCQAKSNASGTDSFLAALTKTRTDLTAALKRVHQQAPQAKVLVVGYPQIVSADHVCARIPLARGDFAYAAKINVALNDALRGAAQDTGSTYVDVYAASKGHDICAADPWINGSVTDQKKALAYHPFAVEQQAVADVVATAATS
jgi:lysophospholipase L1-like esterase